MSLPEVKTTRVWEGLEVEQYTNTATGQTEIYAVNQLNKNQKGVKLAETFSTGTGDASKNNWRITDQKRFRDLVNFRRRVDGQSNFSNEKFNSEFYRKGAQLFNKDRATVLNAYNNYASNAAGDSFRQSFFESNIPLVINPKTQLQVSSTGKKGTQPVNGSQNDPPPPGDQENNQETLIDASTSIGDGVQSSINNSIAARAAKRGGSSAILRYPLKPEGPFEYDYIRIRAYDYKPSSLDQSFIPGKNLGVGYETVILPMQPQISETNGVNWSDDQLNPVQAALGAAAIKTIEKGLDGLRIKNLGETIGELGQTLGSYLKTGETRAAVAAYFAGQAVGANLIGRTTGMVINPNLELLFTGPNLRTFNFNFKLTPRSPEESVMCKKIIYAFKRNMAVQRSTSSLFLLSPRIFQLEYIWKGGAEGGEGQKPGEGEGLHPYLNKFKPCAMTNFNVNYTPDGSYSTFNQTGSMTQFEINMNFTEVMPIYADDNRDDDTKTMGF